jgi:branched-subunit amino acid transport protein
MTAWTVLALIGLGTFGLRSMMLIRSTPLPDAVERRFPLVGPSALAAIAAPALLDVGTATDMGATFSAVLAVLVTFAVWRSRRTIGLPLLAGMGAWWLVQSVLDVA